ncbi:MULTISPECIES: hypothetical protein [unclassified Imperialibacter]|uniref:hypothetical protein n=1 Tax=unclassified Imperialibacter TaxID=2629706 RepID=UPI0012575CBA|nr:MULTISPECIES: hypothetical protein [unclassified Imperialibacter]CAD5250609.1 conserved membrane hypothetical protein [Imperialibacter sp. 75]CAD5286377.1 conserved membrane hypothetical protein [Imperialibacter sp. 89]VVT05504.1 conserved membrane hypothetical protein [Imperialibacter sp. EC-SDR9]
MIGGIPLVLLAFTVVVMTGAMDRFSAFWSGWGLFFLHVPLSIGLFFLLFAREKEEDELFLALRFKAMMHGIRFTFVAMLFLPMMAWVSAIWRGMPYHFPEVGGNLAVVTLLLLYSNATYGYFKYQLAKDEE